MVHHTRRKYNTRAQNGIPNRATWTFPRAEWSLLTEKDASPPRKVRISVHRSPVIDSCIVPVQNTVSQFRQTKGRMHRLLAPASCSSIDPSKRTSSRNIGATDDALPLENNNTAPSSGHHSRRSL